MTKLLITIDMKFKPILNGIVFGGALALLPLIVFGQMSSSNYSIEADSINFGGTRSESANYASEDTLGEIATGFSGSENFDLRAGYQQLDQFPIALTTTGDVTLPAIGGISSNTSTATMTATVETRNPSGYELSIRSQSSPALDSGTDSFADYVPATANPDYNFTLGSGVDGFGFSPQGADVSARFLDDGVSVCGTGSNETPNRCWDGFSTTDKVAADSNAATAIGGNDTDIVFQAGIGPDVIKAPGTYSAIIEITAVAL